MEWENVITLEGLERLSEDEFFNFCAQNPNFRIERQSDGTVTIMSPAGFDTSALNSKISGKLDQWAENHPFGIAADSSAGYLLKDGSMLSPDASWISDERLKAIPPANRRNFFPGCPNFVIEILSPSDSVKALHSKMERWLINGVEVGWLINPQTEEVTIYEKGVAPLTLKGFDQAISCPTVLPEFELDLRKLRPRRV